MIKITVQICREGDDQRVVHTSVMKIWNDLSSKTSALGNYLFEIDGIKLGHLFGFKRLQKDVWDLLFMALKNSKIGERNKNEV